MPKLLRESQVAGAFKRALREAGKADVAVAFWGKGAAGLLGLKNKAQVRIVCNLDHPGCNPDSIEELRELGLQIRAHPDLHAKIYVTPRMVIVGSSNVSTNGLTVEGAAAKGWIEANVASDDPELIDAVSGLFKTLWTDKRSRVVTKADIAVAKARRRELGPALFSPPRARTLLAAAREQPATFKDVYVAVYGADLDAEAKAFSKRVREGTVKPEVDSKTADYGKSWAYQFGKMPAEIWLIDLNHKGKSPRVTGCAKTTSWVDNRDNEKLTTIALPGVVRILGRSYRISAAEKASLVSASGNLLKTSQDRIIPLAKAMGMIDA